MCTWGPCWEDVIIMLLWRTLKTPQKVPLRVDPAVLYCFSTFQVQVVLSHQTSQKILQKMRSFYLNRAFLSLCPWEEPSLKPQSDHLILPGQVLRKSTGMMHRGLKRLSFAFGFPNFKLSVPAPWDPQCRNYVEGPCTTEQPWSEWRGPCLRGCRQWRPHESISVKSLCLV